MSKKSRGFDEYGNPEGHAFDLGGGDEGRVRGEKILLYVDREIGASSVFQNGAHLQQVIAERNLIMDFRLAPSNRHCDLDENLLSGYSQLWYISGSQPTLNDKHIQVIVKYVSTGNGLAIWADNAPYYADANLLAKALIGTSFSGDKMADQVMIPGPELVRGCFIEHPLTQGVNNLYEGVTICTIEPVSGITILGQSHDGQLCIGCFEQANQRVVLDTGFTKLYNDRFQRSAGIARYLSNIAFWLARGSRSVEYKLLTPGREDMATLSSGQTSEDYKFTNKRSTRLTYILQWNGDATFELTIREPHGFVVLKTTAPDSPFRVDLQADILGDWVCQVKGVNLPYSNFPYVLTLVLDRHR